MEHKNSTFSKKALYAFLVMLTVLLCCSCSNDDDNNMSADIETPLSEDSVFMSFIQSDEGCMNDSRLEITTATNVASVKLYLIDLASNDTLPEPRNISLDSAFAPGPLFRYRLDMEDLVQNRSYKLKSIVRAHKRINNILSGHQTKLDSIEFTVEERVPYEVGIEPINAAVIPIYHLVPENTDNFVVFDGYIAGNHNIEPGDLPLTVEVFFDSANAPVGYTHIRVTLAAQDYEALSTDEITRRFWVHSTNVCDPEKNYGFPIDVEIQDISGI